MYTTVRPGARRPDELLGLHRSPVGECDRLPTLQGASLGPERDAERVGDGVVEAAGPLALDEGVSERGYAMVDGKRTKLVAVARQDVAGAKLDELDGIRELPDHLARARRRGREARVARRR